MFHYLFNKLDLKCQSNVLFKYVTLFFLSTTDRNADECHLLLLLIAGHEFVVSVLLTSPTGRNSLLVVFC
jgi:hypothetical protein